MNEKHGCLSSFFSKERLHSFFYLLSFNHKVSSGYLAILWLLEKAMIFSTVMLAIFDKTPWSSVNEKLAYFNILAYFSADTELGFIICCSCFAGFMLLLVTIFCLRLCCHKVSDRIVWDTIISYFLPLISRVLIQFFFLLIFYLAKNFGDVTGLEYKCISFGIITPYDTTHVVLTVIMAVACVEAIIVTVLYNILYQTDKVSLWSINSWQFELASLGLKMVIYAELVLDSSEGLILIVAVLTMGLLITKITLRFLTPLPFDCLYELAELCLDNWLLLLETLIALCEVIIC